MTIDKNIPIYQIVVSGNPISEYYSEKSIYSFNQSGYNNIIRVDAVTPDNMSEKLRFTEKRLYRNNRSREWIPEEKAIWYSHFKCWNLVKQPSIIIEHDCILYRPLADELFKRYIWSFGRTKKNMNLAALAYFIKPSGARTLIRDSRFKPIAGPVDSRIHHFQEWYPRNRLPKSYIDQYVSAVHYIDPEVGTTKPKAKK